MKHTNTVTISLEEYEKLKKMFNNNYICMEFHNNNFPYFCEYNGKDKAIKKFIEYQESANNTISILKIKISDFNNSSFFEKIKYLFKGL